MSEFVQEIQDPDSVWIGYETSSYGGCGKDGNVKWIPKNSIAAENAEKVRQLKPHIAHTAEEK